MKEVLGSLHSEFTEHLVVMHHVMCNLALYSLHGMFSVWFFFFSNFCPNNRHAETFFFFPYGYVG